MKILKLIFIVILAIKVIKTQTLEETQADDNSNSNGEFDTAADEETKEEQVTSIEDEKDVSFEDDVEGRNLQQIQLYNNDERCSDIGVCSGMDYGDKGVIVSFSQKLEIRITSKTTYNIRERNNYYTLTFANSKFANFPLQLFYAFKVQELDFRNCSLETLKWDNFLSADELIILLLSENRLVDIKPSLFSLAENLSFLFLDSNRISTLYNDSFQGLINLNYLDLHNNLIETLPLDIFYYLPTLQQINLAENRIKIVKQSLFMNNPNLFSIHLQHNALNEIEDYAFQNQKLINYLDISHNLDLEMVVVTNIQVENFWARNCSLNRIDIYGEAVHVDLQKNFIKELYFSKPEYLQTLRLKDNALEQISSLALTTNLITLDVSSNPGLKTLPDLWQISSLERLDLSNTSLKEIPINILASPHKLRALNVSYNQIKEINPTNFKYIQKLAQFYIHDNNWNCYNLQMLMDMVIKPFKISYTLDRYDDNFPGEYIHGIKCMYRLEQAEDEYYVDSPAQEVFDLSSSKQQEYNQLKFDNTKEVEQLRRELKAIVGIYEEKFSLVLTKLNEMDSRLREFERFNKTMWQQVAIVV